MKTSIYLANSSIVLNKERSVTYMNIIEAEDQNLLQSESVIPKQFFFSLGLCVGRIPRYILQGDLALQFPLYLY